MAQDVVDFTFSQRRFGWRIANGWGGAFFDRCAGGDDLTPGREHTCTETLFVQIGWLYAHWNAVHGRRNANRLDAARQDYQRRNRMTGLETIAGPERDNAIARFVESRLELRRRISSQSEDL